MRTYQEGMRESTVQPGGMNRFQQEARAWGVTPKQAVFIMLVPVLIILVTVITIPFFDVFVWLTAEDSLFEWGQVLFLLIGSFFFGRVGIRLLRNNKLLAGVFLLAALALFFIAGEEIAWGQRIVGWQTPKTFQEINAQNETTIHNISTAHQLFIYAVMLVGMAGTIAPIAAFLLRNHPQRLGPAALLVPPIFLVPAFLMAFGYRLTRLLMPIDVWLSRLIFQVTKMSEATEVCLYFGLMLFAWLSFRRIRREQGVISAAEKSPVRFSGSEG